MARRATLSVGVFLLLITFGAAAPERPADAFYAAIRTNNLAAVSALLGQGADVNARDSDGVTPLMSAAAVGTIDVMKRLLAAGADVNAHSTLGSSALTWATKDVEKVKLLLDHGADVNVVSNAGRTPLLVATMSDPSAEAVKLLIAHGADVHAADKLQATALHTAAVAADIETLRVLLDAKLDVNARDATNFTPLMVAAAHGHVDAVKLLLSRGAHVNDVSGDGEVITHAPARAKNGMLAFGAFTPLLLAAPGGSLDLIKALLDAGADASAKDLRGMTPLMLAVATDHYRLDVIRLLLDRGAEVNAKSLAGETALDWARKFGETPVVDRLKQAGAVAQATPPAAGAMSVTPAMPSVPPGPPGPADLATAVARSISLLERTSGSQFLAKGGCAACHAQNIMDTAAAAARSKGVRLDDKEAASRLGATRGRFVVSVPHLLERLDVAGTPDVPLFSIRALADGGYPPDRTTDAMTVNVAAQQYPDGRWSLGWTARPPISDGDIGRTALAIRMLKVYAPPGLATEMNARLARAKRWMESAAPTTTEDRTMRLLGLRWADSDENAIGKAASALLATQRADGGWAQRDELPSDAYATGQTVYALAVAGGIPPGNAALQRGVKFLLSTQRIDGSWYVASRAVKFQPYFESGFPYGGDQWISAMATGWATSGLAATMEPRGPATVPVR
jgi:ankyrin repeat protein